MSGPQGNNSSSQKRSKRRRKNKSSAGKAVQFWGDADRLPQSKDTVRITKDPAAVIRSLGVPPLPGSEHLSVHYFDAVYERAVILASALAAAAELVDPDEL